MTLQIGYVPFLQPLPTVAQWWWLLLVPVCLGISIAWKAVRLNSLEHFWTEAFTMTAHCVLAMGALAAGFIALLRLGVPIFPSS